MGIRRTAGRTATVAVMAALTALSGAPAFATSGSDRPPAWHHRTCVVDAGPVHFRTPEAAMRYLAAAWNCSDMAALRHVTNANSRAQLQSMTAEAVNLHFTKCTDYGRPGHHMYGCTFSHDYPKGVAHEDPAPDGRGRAYLDVYPARTPGFYATVVGCG